MAILILSVPAFKEAEARKFPHPVYYFGLKIQNQLIVSLANCHRQWQSSLVGPYSGDTPAISVVLCLGKDLALSSSGMGGAFSLQLFLFWGGGRRTQVQDIQLYWPVS